MTQSPSDSARPSIRREFELTGVVQGVGMRPFLARAAQQLGLSGECHNTSSRVLVQVEGPTDRVDEFASRLREDPPPLAFVERVLARDLPPTGIGGFRILDSAPDPAARTQVAPDTATCDDCLRELFDPADRRYRHPFITCTNCGPRLTIVVDLPYDRPNTTLAGFPMCRTCAREYADPHDRRYHAQPISCHDCGPTLTLRDRTGAVLARHTEHVLAAAQQALAAGALLAIKGLGGYHLACRASDAGAVGRMRERKRRPHQPFAVMAADLDTAAKVAALSAEARRLLVSPARPIVLVPSRPDAAGGGSICAEVAPGLDELGLLLPYTPLHQLLMADADDDAGRLLVMTSGNRTGEPLCHDDSDALARLVDVADVFLAHDRPIAVPVEDSVIALAHADRPIPVRRSRGYAPIPVRLAPTPDERVVLAAGADLKNTVALVRDGLAFVSAHVGDLESLPGRLAHDQVARQLERFHGRAPHLVVADAHPRYASRAWARQRADDLDVDLLEVQHHHAHLAALAAEHGLADRSVLGLVFDGTGYGCDATVWGGELLRTDGGCGCERLGHLGVLPLPGGDAGVRNPVRLAAAALVAAGRPLASGSPCCDALTDPERALLAGPPNTPPTWPATSSVGRLFDVVSSLLGVRHRISYEAQAAIELEAVATRWARRRGHRPGSAASDLAAPLDLPCWRDPQTGTLQIDPLPLIRELDEVTRRAERLEPDGVGEFAWRFHAGLAAGAAELAARAARVGRQALDTRHDTAPVGDGRQGEDTRGEAAATGDVPGASARPEPELVGLTGGVFQNRLLTALTEAELTRRGLQPLTHRVVPPNDGGLALGQAAIGAAWLQTDRRARAFPWPPAAT